MAGGPDIALDHSILTQETVPHSSQFYRDEWGPQSRRPLRFDLHNASDSCCVMAKADHAHSSGLATNPLFTGLRWI